MIISALLLTFYIRFETPLRNWGTDAKPEIIDYLGYIMLAAVFYLGMLCYGGVYDHRHLLKLRAVTAPIIKWSVAWVGLILLASFIVKFQPPISRVFCVMAWVITPSMLVLWRSIFRLILARTSATSAPSPSRRFRWLESVRRASRAKFRSIPWSGLSRHWLYPWPCRRKSGPRYRLSGID